MTASCGGRDILRGEKQEGDGQAAWATPGGGGGRSLRGVDGDGADGRGGAGATPSPEVGQWHAGPDAGVANSGLSGSCAVSKVGGAVNGSLVVLPVAAKTGQVPALMGPAFPVQ